jgi:FkbM family methyltransferase
LSIPRAALTNDDAVASFARLQAQLQALHELRTEARLFPDFETRYVRFVRSLRERLHPRGQRDIRTVTLPDNLTFAVDLGDRLGCDIFYGHLEERFEGSLFLELLADGDTMLDIGANFGYFAVRCAAAVGPTGAVHAFEPDPSAYQLLIANAAANGLSGSLYAHPAAVSDQDGETRFYLAEEAAFSGITATGRSATRDVLTVKTRSLDSFAREHGLDHIDLLKIDVEGHEAAVLRGATDVLTRSPDPLVMLEVSAKNLTDTAREALIAALDGLYAAGFRGLVPDLSSDGGLRDISSPTAAAALTSANLFLVRPGGSTDHRLRAAVARRLTLPANGPAISSTGTQAAAPDPTPTAEGGTRALHLFDGIDPALVTAALRDKSDAEERASTLTNTMLHLREEIAQLRAERAKLRGEVRRLGATPFGLIFRAARMIRRSVVASQRRSE